MKKISIVLYLFCLSLNAYGDSNTCSSEKTLQTLQSIQNTLDLRIKKGSKIKIISELVENQLNSCESNEEELPLCQLFSPSSFREIQVGNDSVTFKGESEGESRLEKAIFLASNKRCYFEPVDCGSGVQEEEREKETIDGDPSQFGDMIVGEHTKFSILTQNPNDEKLYEIFSSRSSFTREFLGGAKREAFTLNNKGSTDAERKANQVFKKAQENNICY